MECQPTGTLSSQNVHLKGVTDMQLFSLMVIYIGTPKYNSLLLIIYFVFEIQNVLD